MAITGAGSNPYMDLTNKYMDAIQNMAKSFGKAQQQAEESTKSKEPKE